MTLLGKVFTAMVLVLSVLFFALSVAVNATHINQKAEAKKFKDQADQATRKNSELNTLIEEYRTDLSIEQAARRTALAALQTELDRVQKELETQTANLINLQSAHTQLVQTESVTMNELKAKTDDNELLREKINSTRQNRDELLNKLVALQDTIGRMTGDYKTLKAREAQIASQLTSAKEKLDVLGIKPGTLVTAPPAVNGQLLAVSNSGTVEVSLGRDDGMLAGFTLDVHRNGQYLGRIRIREVRDDKSLADIMPEYQKGRMQAGDRVDSKLN